MLIQQMLYRGLTLGCHRYEQAATGLRIAQQVLSERVEFSDSTTECIKVTQLPARDAALLKVVANIRQFVNFIESDGRIEPGRFTNL